MKLEQVKSYNDTVGGWRWYEEGEEKDRLWECTEWVEELAIPRLREVGILKPLSSGGG